MKKIEITDEDLSFLITEITNENKKYPVHYSVHLEDILLYYLFGKEKFIIVSEGRMKSYDKGPYWDYEKDQYRSLTMVETILNKFIWFKNNYYRMNYNSLDWYCKDKGVVKIVTLNNNIKSYFFTQNGIEGEYIFYNLDKII